MRQVHWWGRFLCVKKKRSRRQSWRQKEFFSGVFKTLSTKINLRRCWMGIASRRREAAKPVVSGGRSSLRVHRVPFTVHTNHTGLDYHLPTCELLTYNDSDESRRNRIHFRLLYPGDVTFTMSCKIAKMSAIWNDEAVRVSSLVELLSFRSQWKYNRFNLKRVHSHKYK